MLGESLLFADTPGECYGTLSRLHHLHALIPDWETCIVWCIYSQDKNNFGGKNTAT